MVQAIIFCLFVFIAIELTLQSRLALISGIFLPLPLSEGLKACVCIRCQPLALSIGEPLVGEQSAHMTCPRIREEFGFQAGTSTSYIGYFCDIKPGLSHL